MRLDRSIRRCALQAMYQYDADPGVDDDLVRESLVDSGAEADAQKRGLELAQAGWRTRSEADAKIEALTPDWPVRRQAMIDRNLLRLAFHEIYVEGTPVKVAINEAVELAREFGTEESGGFVNAVLDRIAEEAKA